MCTVTLESTSRGECFLYAATLTIDPDHKLSSQNMANKRVSSVMSKVPVHINAKIPKGCAGVNYAGLQGLVKHVHESNPGLGLVLKSD